MRVQVVKGYRGKGRDGEGNRLLPTIALGREIKQSWRYKPDELATHVRVAEDISRLLLSDIANRGLSNTDDTVEWVARAMEDAADRELSQVFATMAEVIKGSRETNPQLTVASLARGMSFAQGFRKSLPLDRIRWTPLSPKWSKFKARRKMPGAGKMFKASGVLEKYLGTNSLALAVKKLGWSEVTITRPAAGAKITTVRAIKQLGLARIELRMMPKVSPMLLPLLRTGSWTSSDGTRRLDKSVFRGTKAAVKLAGPDRYAHTYRPFLAPTLQFFMVYRMPVAMRAAINNLVRK